MICFHGGYSGTSSLDCLRLNRQNRPSGRSQQSCTTQPTTSPMREAVDVHMAPPRINGLRHSQTFGTVGQAKRSPWAGSLFRCYTPSSRCTFGAGNKGRMPKYETTVCTFTLPPFARTSQPLGYVTQGSCGLTPAFYSSKTALIQSLHVLTDPDLESWDRNAGLRSSENTIAGAGTEGWTEDR